MCGICGIVYKDTTRYASRELLQQMSNAIFHRGPDDSGILINKNVGLGFRRLSIIDLTIDGHQPMSNEDNSIWIVFNGEVYNFLQLREELINKGHIFRSKTDTETVLHLWEEEGKECVQKLCGMFAFAIWDSNNQTLFLARDREGEKPLYYANLGDRFIFGSEIKTILKDPDFHAKPNYPALNLYLAYQSVPSPYSAFLGINKLPPAHTLVFKNNQIDINRYWKLSYRNKRVITTLKEEKDLQEEIIYRLRESIRARLMSDVPLGAFLSGGIDSSIVVALMSELMDKPVDTFSIGFPQDEYNELPFARMVAERYNANHHEFIVTPDAISILPELIWHYNEPFADSSAIPTYYISKLAREFVTVVLTGDAGDENFAGYNRYKPIIKSYEGSNPIDRVFNLKDYAILGQLFDFRDPFNSLNRLNGLNKNKINYYLRYTHFNELLQSKLYTPEFKHLLGNNFSIDKMIGVFQVSDAENFLDTTLDFDLSLYLPDTLMTKVDIASMANSLEARTPMLDHRFLEFTATIPANLKLKNGIESKYIFKKAVEPYLPSDVIYRKKMGFGVPIDHWFRSELKNMTYDILLSKTAEERGYFRKDYVRNLIDRHQNGENWASLLWNLLMLELWHLMFIDGSMKIPA